MSIGGWILLFAADSLFALWVLRWGGAAWLEGWRASVLLDWIHAGFWNEEQIRLYALLLWLVHAGWFLLGLFQPSLR